MARLLIAAFVISFLSALPQGANAGDLYHQIESGYHRNVCWPHLHIPQDRAAVNSPFAIMANNGWRRNNLLGDHHFEKDNTKLTTAGQLKVYWILTQTPPHRRSIFLQRTTTPEADAARVQAVQLATKGILPMGQLADVQHTHLQVEGRAAETVDSINTRFRASAPIPVLPAAVASGGGEE